ncbi:NAD kinase [Blastochloris viridis]|uniref:NAD kinase n=1 Tax=Blastochloris viridis TaxID=1079 RepID=A0A0H5BFU2_BLAVI|nr:NAD kinase [Blastochloris viridis]ALK09053.1 putative inorganic polyphosphate/ATP-NAD kinase [Blastochloris viridis]BAS01086.1 NAD kinase [Blastochloris viridis]CUU41715.1 Inorganic polyphosphate/ATP-NAD kinase [Blastochloris viridis]
MHESPRRFDKVAFVGSPAPDAQAALARFEARYGRCDPNDADVVVALGGDGLMLQTLHHVMHKGTPIYGMNCGSVGFLMNDFIEDGIVGRLAAAEPTIIHPLVMTARDGDGAIHIANAINEVSLLRQSYQAAKLRILVDGRERLAELICDGILVATPAGSTAYNLSAHGPILPLDSPLLALTPLSAFRPRRWRGAILPDRAEVRIEVLEADKRPVSAAADHIEVRNVREVSARMDPSISLTMLFDPGHSLDERILREQFGT